MVRSTWTIRGIVLIVGMALVAPAMLWSAEPRAAQTKAPPLVTFVKNDGTSVRGSVVSADPDQVVLQVAPKPGQKAEPEPLTLPWSEIKTASNGLTSAKLLPAWKAEHKDQLCETCRGDRTVVCPTCKGTKHDPASAKDCKTCGGELLVDCKAAKCKKGVIPCPNPDCLKLSEGKWTSGHGHDHIRLFGNGAWVSDGHLGQVWKLDTKTGQMVGGDVCKVCGGKTEMDCPVCHGTAKAPCGTCLARKDAPPCPDQCDAGRVKCSTCEGSGLKKT